MTAVGSSDELISERVAGGILLGGITLVSLAIASLLYVLGRLPSRRRAAAQ